MRPQHCLYGVATTIALDVHDRPTAATVAIYDGDGNEVLPATAATRSTIATTLNGAVVKGAESITVTAATGIAGGLEFWLRAPDEKVLCKSVAGTVVTLRRPLLNDHATGVAVEGTRLTHSATLSTLFWDGQAVWTLDSARQVIQAICCSKYPFDVDLATEQDLLDADAQLAERLSSGWDSQRALVKGGEEVLKRLSASTSGRPFTFVGTPQLTDAVVLATLWRLYQPMLGEQAARLYERYDQALTAELERVMSGIVYRDEDQNKAIEPHEQRSMRSGRRYRA